jgi:tetratricopeptide (TPR) repeat protein
VFSWSYRQLSTEAARMFRLLGLHPGPDIAAPAAASLAAVDGPEALRLLRELTHECLLAEYSPGRYAFHDLLRAYAADQARDRDSEPERAAAVSRTLDHYLHAGRHGMAMLLPAGPQIDITRPRPGTTPERPADYQQAVAWFEAEHQVLLAAIALAAGSGFDTHAWQLPWAISQFQHLRGHYHEAAASQRTALAAATRLGDAAGQATSSRLLANACVETGHHDEALGHYMTSLQLYRRLGDSPGEIGALRGLARVAERQGRYADALAHSEHALRLGQAIGDKAGEAEDLNNVGWGHALLGDYQQARAFCQRALAVADEAGSRSAEYHAWDSLGYVEHQLGNFGDAAACYRRALATCREIGSRSTQVVLLTHIGDASRSAGDLPQARETWRQALAILEDLGHPDADKVRGKLATLEGRDPDHGERAAR